MSTHDEIRELLGAFALDAVDDQAAVEIRAHLAQCTACATEVDQHHEMTAMLANTGGDAPAHLWARIEAQLETARPAGDAPTDRDEVAARRATRSAHRAARLRVRLLAAAAVVVLIAALAVQVVRLDDRVGVLQGASLQQQVARAAHRAIADPAAQHVVLDSSISGRLAVIAVLPTGAAFLVNDALPSLPPDRTYQLWGLVGSRLISLGLLGARPTAVSFDVGRLGLVTKYAITAERAGGVVQSTHQPVAVSA
ncbi:MAG TPA: anti-sigma factor [Acidimicrobiales bacterium]|jgi:anti-sigma factor RsiW|nr:anti-sigma factor [Acidimicrobiales bacterium]